MLPVPGRPCPVASWVLVVGVVTAVGGCAQLPRDPPEAGAGERLWALHQARVAAVSSWRVEGKISIRRDERLWRAGLDWFHDGNGNRVNLLGPGGRTLMRLSDNPRGVSARDSKGRAYHADTFEELVADTLGVELPASSLRYWVAGLPDPRFHSEFTHVNHSGVMREFKQQGWRVKYLDYRPVRYPVSRVFELPSLLTLNRDDMEVTVAVKRWSLIKFDGPVEHTI